MQAQALQRRLDPIESLIHGVRLPWLAECHGSFDVEAFKKSTQILCARYPVLKGKICESDSGLILTVPEGSKFLLNIIDGTGIDFLEQFGVSSRHADNPTAVISVVRNDSLTRVIFDVSHAIADAHASFSYFAELWNIYTSIINGYEVDANETFTLPSPPSEILKTSLAKRIKHLGHEPNDIEQTTHADGNYSRIVQSDIIQFSTLDTANIIRSAKASAITVGMLIAGALARELQEPGNDQNSNSTTLTIGVDLRQCLNPPIRTVAATHMVSRRQVTIDECCSIDTLSMAQKISEKLRDKIGIENEDLLTSETADLMKRTILTELNAKSRITVNNWGVVPEFKCPSNLRIKRFGLASHIHHGSKSTQSVNRPYHWITAYAFAGKLYMHLSGTDIMLLHRIRQRLLTTT